MHGGWRLQPLSRLVPFVSMGLRDELIAPVEVTRDLEPTVKRISLLGFVLWFLIGCLCGAVCGMMLPQFTKSDSPRPSSAGASR